jgi:hypothetical protein
LFEDGSKIFEKDKGEKCIKTIFGGGEGGGAAFEQ